MLVWAFPPGSFLNRPVARVAPRICKRCYLHDLIYALLFEFANVSVTARSINLVRLWGPGSVSHNSGSRVAGTILDESLRVCVCACVRMLVDVCSIVDSVRFLGLNLGVWVRKPKQFALEVLHKHVVRKCWDSVDSFLRASVSW